MSGGNYAVSGGNYAVSGAVGGSRAQVVGIFFNFILELCVWLRFLSKLRLRRAFQIAGFTHSRRCHFILKLS